MKKNIPIVVLATLWLLFTNDLCNVAHARGAANYTVAPVASGLQDTTKVRDTLTIEEVEINTGYQRIPKERATGSFVFIDSALLNRSFSSDILSRLEGVVSGLRFNRTPDQPDDIDMTLRGPSTIQAADQPLIVLDNFEYQGDLNNINPNDIASITVLRDAAASSIWGAKAGNGVIVITTKRGKSNDKLGISFTANTSFTSRPNLYATPQLSSSEFIDLQSYLFENGHYASTLRSANRPAVAPAIWLMHQHQQGSLSETEFTEKLDALRGLDTREDLNRHIYQPRIKQQYAVSLSGSNSRSQYYASVGWDHDRQNLVGNDSRRLTVNLNNNTSFFDNKLTLRTGFLYTNTLKHDNGLLPISGLNYPYGQLADDQGSALPIARYNPGFIDTVGNGRLLDWEYRPLDELRLADNSAQLIDLKLNVDVGFRFTPWLAVNALYQHSNGRTLARDHYHQDTYFARDVINQFSYFSPTGEVNRPVPLGGILDLHNQSYTAHQGRLQANIDHQWDHHEVRAIFGGEINDAVSESNGSRRYGYIERQPGGVNVDAVNPYTSMVTGRTNLRIGTPQTISYLTDRFISVYANAGYSFAGRYHFSTSARRDGSNLFGVNTNQQWNPLWSAGLKWDISKEEFFERSWLPDLSARITYGSSGNIDRSVTAYLTAMYLGQNSYGLPVLAIQNPPNPNLTWETVNTLNAGLDFSISRNRRISGSIDYFHKRSLNLMSDAELAAVSGLSTYRGNTASLAGDGIDLSLTSINLVGPLKWQSTLLYSMTRNRVTAFRITPVNVTSMFFVVREVGRPLDAIYAFQWLGLNPENGNPIGVLNGEPSEDYTAITSSTNYDDLQYIGSRDAPHFGSLRNDFGWHNFSLSFNISFKMGHYGRSPLILNYGSLYGGSYQSGSSHFTARWQNPGDELHTNVPSMVYPAVYNRDQYYGSAATHYASASHIRLQDVRLGYRHNALQVYVLATNLGILWQADQQLFDPDYSFRQNRPIFSGGIKLDL